MTETIYYEVGMSHFGVDGKGKLKTIKFALLIDARSFTEAEAKAFAYAEAEKLHDIKVLTIKRSNVAEVVAKNDEGNWYKVNLLFEGGKKKTKSTVAVKAENVKEVRERVVEWQKECVTDYEITTIDKTVIEELIEPDKQKEEDDAR